MIVFFWVTKIYMIVSQWHLWQSFSKPNTLTNVSYRTCTSFFESDDEKWNSLLNANFRLYTTSWANFKHWITWKVWWFSPILKTNHIPKSIPISFPLRFSPMKANDLSTTSMATSTKMRVKEGTTCSVASNSPEVAVIHSNFRLGEAKGQSHLESL